MKNFRILFVLFVAAISSCSDDQTVPVNNQLPAFKYLALGDSYTIGESVCATCRFPAQLKDSLENTIPARVDLRIIAQTGWTTTSLKNAISTGNVAADYDLVTLLIGVNDQYQNRPLSTYEQEFPALVAMAVTAAAGDKSNVLVVSIPDYAYTPFGQSSGNSSEISTELDQFNSFAQSYCESQDIRFVNITDITRDGLSNPALVAVDGLHPSELAYTKFVERLLPVATAILEN